MIQSAGVVTSGRKFTLAAWYLGIAVYVLLVAVLIVWYIRLPNTREHYYYQAVSWLHGELNVDNAPPDIQDVVTFNGHRYLPLGPLPAVLTLPLVAIFGDSYQDFYLTYPLIILTIWIGWRILGKLKIAYTSTALWLLVLFFMSTVYFSAALQRDGAWFIAHVVTCLFLFLGINEALGQRRGLLMGLYLGLATATRFTAVFTFPFFLVVMAVQDPMADSVSARQSLAPWPVIIRRFVLFGIGAGLPLAAYFGYNYVRFHSFFESGYSGAAVLGSVLDQARAQGLFSLVHLPKNLYYFFLAMPDPYSRFNAANPADNPILTFPFLRPSPWGMSIFLTTPAVVYVVKARLRKPLVVGCWLAILLTAIPIFTYYGVGWIQFGFRYALDFTPFLWLLIVVALRETEITLRRPNLALWLLLIGCVINLWGAYWLPIMRYLAPMPSIFG